MPFQPGNKIRAGTKNPNAGRKSTRQLDELERVLSEAISYEDRVDAARILASVARSGDVPALSLLFAYLYGKPIARQEISGPEGEAISVKHEYDDLRKLPPDELVRLHRETLDTLS